MSGANSTVNSKVSKPYPEFPLTPHPSGRWCKKIKGKLHYFGKLADGSDAALADYLGKKDALHAGRQPVDNRDGLTVQALCRQFLCVQSCAAKRRRAIVSPLQRIRRRGQATARQSRQRRVGRGPRSCRLRQDPKVDASKAKTQAALTDLIRTEIRPFLGSRFSSSQPIKLRMDEMSSGVRADVAVKLFGDDIRTLQKTATKSRRS